MAALAGLSITMLMGGVLGLVLGAAAALGTAIALRRMEPREERQRRLRLSADLPVAVDLLAACLRGGASWAAAVEAVADALGGPVADELRGVAAKVKLGADPASAWWALTERPELAALGRTVARAVDSGAALAPALTRLAEDRRRSANAEATARARAVGIRGVAPLGLCFLPAFVLLGLVPVIAGIARDLLPPL